MANSSTTLQKRTPEPNAPVSSPSVLTLERDILASKATTAVAAAAVSGNQCVCL